MSLLDKENFTPAQAPDLIKERVFKHVYAPQKKFRIPVWKYVGAFAIAVVLFWGILFITQQGSPKPQLLVHTGSILTGDQETGALLTNNVGEEKEVTPILEDVTEPTPESSSKNEDYELARAEVDATLGEVQLLLALLEDDSAREIN